MVIFLEFGGSFSSLGAFNLLDLLSSDSDISD